MSAWTWAKENVVAVRPSFKIGDRVKLARLRLPDPGYRSPLIGSTQILTKNQAFDYVADYAAYADMVGVITWIRNGWGAIYTVEFRDSNAPYPVYKDYRNCQLYAAEAEEASAAATPIRRKKVPARELAPVPSPDDGEVEILKKKSLDERLNDAMLAQGGPIDLVSDEEDEEEEEEDKNTGAGAKKRSRDDDTDDDTDDEQEMSNSPLISVDDDDGAVSAKRQRKKLWERLQQMKLEGTDQFSSLRL